MDKNEKIQAIKEKVTGWINSIGGRYNHVECNGEMVVKVANYFPEEKEPFGSFVYKMYSNRLEIASPLTPRYSMLDTQATINSISYEQLTEEDTDIIYNELFLS